MNQNPVFIIFRNNSYICRVADSTNPLTFKFQDITNLPNIPFYHHIWSDFPRFKHSFGRFFRNELTGNSLLGMVVKSRCYLAVPDDMLEFEKALSVEFLMQTCCRKVEVKPECLLLAPGEKEYVAVHRTCRMFVLSHIQDGLIENRLYVGNDDLPVDELQGYIRALLDESEREDLPVYLSGEELEDYAGLGMIVEPKTILQNYIDLVW